RIDIKSEAEAEAERAERELDNVDIAEALPDLSPEAVAALLAAGLRSPRAVLHAGVEKLRTIVEVADRAEEVFAAARRWMEARTAAPEPEPAAEPTEPTPGPTTSEDGEPRTT